VWRRAARTLFGFPVVQALGSALPFSDAAVDAVWSLGVLCTTPLQLELLSEIRRVVRPPGRVALLAFVAREPLARQPEGNHFPSADELAGLLEAAGLDIQARRCTANLPAIPADWTHRVETVTDALTERYGDSTHWQIAERQGRRMADLLEDGKITGELLVLRHS
jgi:SAM-dependent methyltransferase